VREAALSGTGSRSKRYRKGEKAARERVVNGRGRESKEYGKRE